MPRLRVETRTRNWKKNFLICGGTTRRHNGAMKSSKAAFFEHINTNGGVFLYEGNDHRQQRCKLRMTTCKLNSKHLDDIEMRSLAGWVLVTHLLESHQVNSNDEQNFWRLKEHKSKCQSMWQGISIPGWSFTNVPVVYFPFSMPLFKLSQSQVESSKRKSFKSIHVKDKRVYNSAFDVSVQAGTVPRLWDTFITRNARHSRNGSGKPGRGTRYRLMVPKIKLNRRFIVSALFLLPSLPSLPSFPLTRIYF